MNNQVFLRVVKVVNDLLHKEGFEIDQEARNSISHFLAYDEYEMAYEGLLIEMINSGYMPSRDEAEEYLKIGRALGLDKESVFDPQFWRKLESYLIRLK